MLNEVQKCIDNCGQALMNNKDNFKAVLMMGDTSVILAHQKL